MNLYVKLISALAAIITSYIIYITVIINKGFFQGYSNTELDIDFADYVCFYYRIGLFDVIKVGREAHEIKNLNFNGDSVQNAWELLKSLNSIQSRIRPCLAGLSKLDKDEESKFELLKKIGKKFFEFIPFADQIQKGIVTVELALQFKNMVNLIESFYLSDFSSILTIHENVETLSTAIGRMTSTMEELFKIEDLKIVKSIIDELSKIA